MLPAAQRLVDSHRNDLVVMATATNRYLVEPIAAAFGVPHVVATEPQIVDGRFTGDVVGAPCMRAGKIARLDTWLATRGQTLASFAQSWFYSDSINDLPLLERVTHPVAVDADPKLADIAAERGWRQLTLR
jgi:phosphoserine phosphatase